MSCNLRIYGALFDIDAVLKEITLPISSSWKAGTPKSFPKGKLYDDSGFGCTTSDADLDEFNTQVKETLAFLKKHKKEIIKYTSRSDVQSAEIDFGVSLYVSRSIAITTKLPNDLIKVVAECGLSIYTSVYLCSDDDQEE